MTPEKTILEEVKDMKEYLKLLIEVK